MKLGRVLLLEDDPAFQEVIRDFLAENGYAVVPVKNGGEGVAQVMEGDFDLVLCDLNMPGFPGDMFYRAVERIRPDLCGRFVFMTGYRGDAKLNDYIKSIGCWVLRKPFPLENILALFAFTAEREMLETVCDWGPGPGKPASVANVPPLLDDAFPQPGGLPGLPPSPRIPVSASTASISWLGDAYDSIRPRRSFSRWLDITVVVAVILGYQYLDENNAASTGLAEQRALQTQWNLLQPNVEKAAALRSDFDQARTMIERSRAWGELRWTTALRDIALAMNASIEVVEIQARENPEDHTACEARIRGRALGEQARRVADRFRRAIEESLATDVGGRVASARFEELEDAQPDSAEGKGVSFTIAISVSPASPVAMIKKEAR